ncbi:MAG: hypothetical protein M0Z48_04480 [Nitrospiraceae bacterium]|nr:hypothetical protein [Nitrospiraceae bacterium]
MSEGLGSNSPSNGGSTSWIGSLLSDATQVASSYFASKSSNNPAVVQASAATAVQTTQLTTIMYLGLGLIAVVIIYKLVKR